MKTTASVADLKARLSEFLRRVKSGSEVVITERGVPVARLTGLESAERRATRRDRLVRSGAVRLGKGRVRRLLQAAPAGDPAGTMVLRALLDERAESR
ncbi:MAG: type II toxin-antitoxin system prevent-host-death family antitoxin [Vicinamibacteraceae bacterium]|nr:type II toxin-antitoxin system prevent-host-death family antitoxin [Vicinamibacteraceae bacterium]